MWGMQQPKWSETAPDMKVALDALMDDFFQRFSGKVDMIDVVNESQAQPAGYREQLGGAGETGWDWVLYSFRRARFYGDKYGYKGKLVLNEIGIENNGRHRKNVCKIAGLLKKENLIDAIGVQGHFLEKIPVGTVKQALDELAATGVPLLISEFDVNEKDDQKQLEKFSELFTMFWEHPAVQGVTLWGCEEGRIWRKGAYLVRKDGTDRPAMTWLRNYMTARRTKPK